MRSVWRGEPSLEQTRASGYSQWPLLCLAFCKSHSRAPSVFADALPEPKFRRLCRHFPHAHHGFDRKGQPIYIDCTGLLDVEALMDPDAENSCTQEEVVRSHVVMMVSALC